MEVIISRLCPTAASPSHSKFDVTCMTAAELPVRLGVSLDMTSRILARGALPSFRHAWKFLRAAGERPTIRRAGDHTRLSRGNFETIPDAWNDLNL